MSKKHTGIHLYINLNNLNALIKKEEKNTDTLSRTMHALNTYICGVEKYCQYYNDIIVIEKFTTTRLHLYFTNDNNEELLHALIEVLYFSQELANYLPSIGKYKNISMFKIGAGADYGQFVEFEFVDKDSELTEITTIGSPANRAAKLQSKSGDGEFVVSKALIDIMPKNMRSLFFGDSNITNAVSGKYYDILPEKAQIVKLKALLDSFYERKKDECLQYVYSVSQKTNLGQVVFSEVRTPIDYENLSLNQPKKVYGVMLYADIRNFTKKVDRTSLQEIEQFTERVLKKMYVNVLSCDGIHVQFQGDRESGIFHKYKNQEDDFAVNALFAAMKMLDLVAEENTKRQNSERLDIGIGCSIGDIYVSRLGIRNNKFNIAMGETVQEADYAEDVIAGSFGNNSSEIAITDELYSYLYDCGKINQQLLKDVFTKRGKYYICTTRYSKVENRLSDKISSLSNPLAIYNCDVSHRKIPPFKLPKKESFNIKAYIINNGNKYEYKSNSYELDKNIELQFQPCYSIPDNCYAVWQITNTGYEAHKADCMRGDFDLSTAKINGKLAIRKEQTSYRGRHIVQCFIKRSRNECIAMSEPFIVWIK